MSDNMCTNLECMAQNISLIYFLVILFLLIVLKDDILVPRTVRSTVAIWWNNSCFTRCDDLNTEAVWGGTTTALIIITFGFSSCYVNNRVKE